MNYAKIDFRFGTNNLKYTTVRRSIFELEYQVLVFHFTSFPAISLLFFCFCEFLFCLGFDWCDFFLNFVVQTSVRGLVRLLHLVSADVVSS